MILRHTVPRVEHTPTTLAMTRPKAEATRCDQSSPPATDPTGRTHHPKKTAPDSNASEKNFSGRGCCIEARPICALWIGVPPRRRPDTIFQDALQLLFIAALVHDACQYSVFSGYFFGHTRMSKRFRVLARPFINSARPPAPLRRPILRCAPYRRSQNETRGPQFKTAVSLRAGAPPSPPVPRQQVASGHCRPPVSRSDRPRKKQYPAPPAHSRLATDR
jgi:hypothetical protein